MSDNKKLNKLLQMIVLGVVSFLIAAFVFGPTLPRMAFVMLGIYFIGWGVGYYMDTPCPADKEAKSS